MNYGGMNADSGRLIGDIEHIRQSVRDILITPVGSRVMRREYGSMLPDLIDQPLNGATLLRAYAATVMALVRWEPRIRITRVQFAVDGSQLTVDLSATRVDGAGSSAQADLSISLRGINA
jgi:phage baseplate assembly protein W